MIPPQHTSKFLDQPVREFFCPEIKSGSLSYNNSTAYHVQDLCRSANIVTLNDLRGKTEADLRSVSFTNDVITLIRARLAEVNLSLKDEQSSRPAFAESAPPSRLQKVIVLDRAAGVAAYVQHFSKK